MTSIIKKNLLILIIILILGSYLGIKAFDENGWDGWAFGSAQELMVIQYWVKDGFAKNYFLFITSPYSKLIQYLDEPEFRNRQIDTMGSSLTDGPLTRGRVYYTHYPPFFLVPYAILAKIGITERAVLRIFSLILSLSTLVFFYWFIKSVSNKTTAVVAAIYYGFSVTFLNYADSVSTQPFTIFFTFLILILSIYGRHNILIWFLYLGLSLSSYDATFFVFAWLVLYDAVVLKKFLWRKWLFWASAPVLGFTLQIIQNAWYLGWNDMISDFRRVYAQRTFRGVKNFIIGLIAPFYSMTSLKTVFIFKKTIVTIISVVAIFGILWKFRQRIGLDFDYFKIVFVLAISAIAQPFFVNTTGSWSYSGFLAVPFWGLLIGAASIFIVSVFRHKESIVYKTASFGILTATILMLWSVQFYTTLTYVKDWPNNRPNQKIIDFSKTIQSIEPGKEKIAFRIMPQDPYSIWVTQFPVSNFEYYLGVLKIDFANSRDLLVDFWWLRNRSEYPYYSFVIAENKTEIENIRNEIKKTLKISVSEIKDIQGQYVFVVSPDEIKKSEIRN